MQHPEGVAQDAAQHRLAGGAVDERERAQRGTQQGLAVEGVTPDVADPGAVEQPERTVRGEQTVTVGHQRGLHVPIPGDHVVEVFPRIRRDIAMPRAIAGQRQVATAEARARCVARVGQTAEVKGPPVRPGHPRLHRHGRAHDAGLQRLGQRPLAGVHARRRGGTRVENALDVHEHRLVARGDEIVREQVATLQQLHEPHQHAQPAVVPAEGIGAVAGAGCDDLLPAVLAAQQDGVGRQTQRQPGHVEIGDQIGERQGCGEVLGLVHDRVAGGEVEQRDRPAARMPVAGTAGETVQRAGIGPAPEVTSQGGQVRPQPLEHLHGDIAPLLAGQPDHVGEAGQRLQPAQPSLATDVEVVTVGPVERSGRRGGHLQLEPQRRVADLHQTGDQAPGDGLPTPLGDGDARHDPVVARQQSFGGPLERHQRCGLQPGGVVLRGSGRLGVQELHECPRPGGELVGGSQRDGAQTGAKPPTGCRPVFKQCPGGRVVAAGHAQPAVHPVRKPAAADTRHTDEHRGVGTLVERRGGTDDLTQPCVTARQPQQRVPGAGETRPRRDAGDRHRGWTTQGWAA